MGLIKDMLDLLALDALDNVVCGVTNSFNFGGTETVNSIEANAIRKFEKVMPKKYREYLSIAEKSRYKYCLFFAANLVSMYVTDTDRNDICLVEKTSFSWSDNSGSFVCYDYTRNKTGSIELYPGKYTKKIFSKKKVKYNQDIIVKKENVEIANLHIYKSSHGIKPERIELKSERWNGDLFGDNSWKTKDFRITSYFGLGFFSYIEYNDLPDDLLEDMFMIYFAMIKARDIINRVELEK